MSPGEYGRCPRCDRQIAGFTWIAPGIPTQPQAGDVVVCFTCGAACVVRPDLTIRPITRAELRARGRACVQAVRRNQAKVLAQGN